MPASYVHQCAAADICQALSLFEEPRLRYAVLAGSEGPDPLFFSVLSPNVPKLGSILHTRKTDDFLLALADACRGSALTRAYCCGFFSHYGTDTTFHPFVYAHSLTADGYSSTAHCTLEHQLETLHYRRRGNPHGLPIQMEGFTRLSSADKDEIARALHSAILRVFPGDCVSLARIRTSFDDAVRLCALLRSESGAKFRMLGALLHPFLLDAPLHAHMMPAEPPKKDIMNDGHHIWSSIWTPDIPRSDSFSDLYEAAVSRGAALMRAANNYMLSNGSYASLRALHGGLSYDSGLPWQTTCKPSQAPGIRAGSA